MYKNREKKLDLLLDKLLLYTTEKPDSLHVIQIDYQIFHFLQDNKEILPVNIQKKVIQILPVSHSYTLLKALQSKDYQHLSCEVVKLLDLSDPSFSAEVIETLYKMATYQFVDEIRPFATLSIDDKLLFTQGSFKVINDTANKLKDKHTAKKEGYKRGKEKVYADKR